MDARGVRPTARTITVRARTFIAAGGAIGTPGLLLRSRVPDPNGLIGRRTFLHPTVVSVARMPARIDPFAGAPQTVYSDHFLDTLPPEGPVVPAAVVTATAAPARMPAVATVARRRRRTMGPA